MKIKSSLATRILAACTAFWIAGHAGIAQSENLLWQPWLPASQNSIDVPAPSASDDQELQAMADTLVEIDNEKKRNVHHWPVSNPNYRWMQMALERYAKGSPSPVKGRGLALLNVAIHDAVAVASQAKFNYKRNRPAVEAPLLATPETYSYPSAHAAAAGAAAGVLGYLFPDEKDYFLAQAELAADARVHGGSNYPSDVTTGLDIGRQTSENVITYANTDNSDSEWKGTRPTGADKLQGDVFVYPTAGEWKTWAIETPSAHVPGPPSAVGTDQLNAQIRQMHEIDRNVPNSIRAWVNHSTYRAYQWWYEQVATYVFEQASSLSISEVALAYATVSASNHDAIVACFKAKYTYWFIRPAQLDSTMPALFPNPPHPSYPAAHSCSSMNYAVTISHFFPDAKKGLQAAADEAGSSRIIAGIHFPMDKTSGETLGRGVAEEVLAHVKSLRIE